MPTTCSAQGRVFSVMSGHGVTPGMVVLHAGGHSLADRCERYGEEMTREEAVAEGLRQGYLVYFRDTESFMLLAVHFLKHYGEEKVIELAKREELDPKQLLADCYAHPSYC